MWNLEKHENREENISSQKNTKKETLYSKDLREKREWVQERIDIRENLNKPYHKHSNEKLDKLKEVCKKSIYCTPPLQFEIENLVKENEKVERENQKLIKENSQTKERFKKIEQHALKKDKKSIEERYIWHSKVITKDIKEYIDTLKEKGKTDSFSLGKYKILQKHFDIYQQALKDFWGELTKYQEAYKQYEKTWKWGEEMDKKTLHMYTLMEELYIKSDSDYWK